MILILCCALLDIALTGIVILDYFRAARRLLRQIDAMQGTLTGHGYGGTRPSPEVAHERL